MYIQEPAKIINNEFKNNNSLLYDTPNVESDADILRINDDLSNLDDILNSNGPLLNNNNKTTDKSDKSTVIIIPILIIIYSIILDDGSYVLSNTCAFDSVIQIRVLAVAYCDSDEYKSYVDEKKNVNELRHLVSTLLRDGLNVQTYRKRAKILKQFYSVEPMFNGVGYLSVEQAVDNLLIKLLH